MERLRLFEPRARALFVPLPVKYDVFDEFFINYLHSPPIRGTSLSSQKGKCRRTMGEK